MGFQFSAPVLPGNWMRERHGKSDAPTGPRLQVFCRLCSRSYFQNFAFISESDSTPSREAAIGQKQPVEKLSDVPLFLNQRTYG